MTTERRNHVTFVLGAGFSAAGGVPTMAQFFQSAREFYDNPSTSLSPKLRAHYEHVMDFRREARALRDTVQVDLNNIETLFSLLDMRAMLRPAGREADVAAIKHVIAHTVERTAGSKAESVGLSLSKDTYMESVEAGWTGLAAHAGDRLEAMLAGSATSADCRLPIYELFAALITGVLGSGSDAPTASIVTFNYDTLIEDALRAVGVRVDYRLQKAPYKGSRPTVARNRTLRVIKLHGSVNWAYPTKKNTWLHVYDRYGDYSETMPPLIVPPTWRKGAVGHAIEASWQRATEELARATQICVIGYSWPRTDEHFRHLMAVALEENQSLYRLTLVDLHPVPALWGAPHATRATATQESPAIKEATGLFEPLAGYGRVVAQNGGFESWLRSNGLQALGFGMQMPWNAV